MEYFHNGIALLSHWYINPNGKSKKCKYSLPSELTKVLTDELLQGNFPLTFVLTEICLQ